MATGVSGTDTGMFHFSILVLHSPIEQNHKVTNTQTWKKKVKKKLLSGEMGFDMTFALEPFSLSTRELGTPTRLA